MKYRILIYGTSRRTGLLEKHSGHVAADTPRNRELQIAAARRTLIDPRVIAVERVRSPIPA